MSFGHFNKATTEASVCMFVIPYDMKFYVCHYLARSLRSYRSKLVLGDSLWAYLQLIVGTVHHQLSATNCLILNYLYELLSKIGGLSPDCRLILLGDFNKLNGSRSDGKQFH